MSLHAIFDDHYIIEPDFDDNEPFIEHLRHVVATTGSIRPGIDVEPDFINFVPWHGENYDGYVRKTRPVRELPPLPPPPPLKPVWETPIVHDMAEYGAMLARKIREEARFDEHIAQRRLEMAAQRLEGIKAAEARFYASLNR